MSRDAQKAERDWGSVGLAEDAEGGQEETWQRREGGERIKGPSRKGVGATSEAGKWWTEYESRRRSDGDGCLRLVASVGGESEAVASSWGEEEVWRLVSLRFLALVTT